MDSRKQILHDMLPIVIGQCLCSVATCIVFAVIGRFDLTVILGNAAGSILAIGNYAIMYWAVCKASSKAQNQDVAGGQKLIQLSYTGRMIGLLIALILLAKSGLFHVITLAIPLALNRPILTVHEWIMQRKGGANV